jgi:uncharacterized coiled-coil DUF342 family protein
MEIVTIENKAFKSLCDKIDKVHEELLRLQNPVKQLSNEWIDTYDVMNILQVSRRTLTKYLTEGKLKHTKHQKKNYFRLKDVEEFLARNNQYSTPLSTSDHGAE